MSTLTPATLAAIRTSNAAIITRNQAAEILQVDPRTVTEGIKNGTIPGLKVGKRVVIPREKFLALFDTEAA